MKPPFIGDSFLSAMAKQIGSKSEIQGFQPWVTEWGSNLGPFSSFKPINFDTDICSVGPSTLD